MEAARLREEKHKAEMERYTKELESLRWENMNSRRGEVEVGTWVLFSFLIFFFPDGYNEAPWCSSSIPSYLVCYETLGALFFLSFLYFNNENLTSKPFFFLTF